jgi:surfeit locus 1 family protein
LSTLIVLAAVATMIALGFWQLDRLGQKQELIRRYRQSQSVSSVAEWPRYRNEIDKALYRRASVVCREVAGWQSVAGTNASGRSGIAHIAQCAWENTSTSDGPNHHLDVVLGWSNRPDNPDWKGGLVHGTIAPGGEFGLRLVADPPLAGLEAIARPDPSNIPNNHLSYAVQWFLFAATALVIYLLAVRKRLVQSSPERGGGAA